MQGYKRQECQHLQMVSYKNTKLSPLLTILLILQWNLQTYHYVGKLHFRLSKNQWLFNYQNQPSLNSSSLDVLEYLTQVLILLVKLLFLLLTYPCMLFLFGLLDQGLVQLVFIFFENNLRCYDSTNNIYLSHRIIDNFLRISKWKKLRLKPKARPG